MAKKKNPVGCPSKYSPEYCQEIIEYFSVPLFKVKQYGPAELNVFPTIERYAASVRCVTRQTLINWTKEHKEFLEAFNRAKELQQALAVEGGISRAYDSGFTRFLLNSISDTYKEKAVEVELSKDAQNMVRLGYALPKKEGDKND